MWGKSLALAMQGRVLGTRHTSDFGEAGKEHWGRAPPPIVLRIREKNTGVGAWPWP